MRHTFLLEPGRWTAEGRYLEATGGETEAVGETHVEHEADAWTLTGSMTLKQPSGEVTFANAYRIEAPVEPEPTAVAWTSENPALGRFTGRFALVEDAILSFGRTEDGKAETAESLLRLDEATYEARGALFVEGALAGRWAVTLKRV